MHTNLSIVSLSLAIGLFSSSAAQAATLINFAGTTHPTLVTGTATINLAGDVLTGTLTNTSLFDARLMGFGFDIGAGNINGFTGSANVGFLFSDDDFGNVPQFSSATIDFGAAVNCSGTTTDNDCTLNGGGSPNNGLDFGQTVTFTVTGPFGALTESQVAASLLVRAQRVGADGQLSDVAAQSLSTVPLSPVPEPGSMMLLGTGLLYLARRRWQGAAK